MSRPTVLVLAGGASNRFWPLRDKPLIPFAAHTLLGRHLAALYAAGCERAVVVARPETREAVEAIGAESVLPDVRVAVQPEARGMADAVRCARGALESGDDTPLYVTQAQDVVDPAMHAGLLDRWSREGATLGGLLAAARVSSYFPGGYLTLEGGRVTSVVEKPSAGNEPSDLVKIVAHVFASYAHVDRKLSSARPRSLAPTTPTSERYRASCRRPSSACRRTKGAGKR